MSVGLTRLATVYPSSLLVGDHFLQHWGGFDPRPEHEGDDRLTNCANGESLALPGGAVINENYAAWREADRIILMRLATHRRWRYPVAVSNADEVALSAGALWYVTSAGDLHRVKLPADR